jgi:hypothetical protein
MTIEVSNVDGVSNYEFPEYIVFLDNNVPDFIFFTPFLPADFTVTLSTSTEYDVDVALILQDPSGTALTSSSTLPATLDFDKLNIRGLTFTFINPDDQTANGAVKGALHEPFLP